MSPVAKADFKTDRAYGEAGEARVSAFLEELFAVSPAEKCDQKRGIDCHLWDRSTGDCSSLEIKTDRLAGKTGRVFLETRSADTEGAVMRCSADAFAVFIPDTRQLYIFATIDLQEALPGWIARHGLRTVRTTQGTHESFNAEGCAVPISEIARLAVRTFILPPEDRDG